jgi:hypothetical protein
MTKTLLPTFILLILIGVLGLCRGGETVDNAWHYGATFPGPTKQTSQEVDDQIGKVIWHNRSYVTDNGMYSIECTDTASTSGAPGTAADIYKRVLQSVLDEIKGTNLRSQSPCKLDNIEGQEYIIDIVNSRKAVMRGRLFLVGTLVYNIVYFGQADTESKKEVSDFFDSFRLLH